MIKNSLGDKVEFDMVRARELSKHFDRWVISEVGRMPFGLIAIVLSCWGYEAALDEIEDLRKQLQEARK